MEGAENGGDGGDNGAQVDDDQVGGNGNNQVVGGGLDSDGALLVWCFCGVVLVVCFCARDNGRIVGLNNKKNRAISQ